MSHYRMCEVLLSALIAGVLYTGCGSPAEAQNTTCSNRPNGDSSNACANTRFVFDNGGNIVSSTLGWYIVGSAQYPTAQSAVNAANAAGGGVVYVPCKPPANSTYALGGASIGLDMRNMRNVRLVGGNSVNGGGAVCTYLYYSGTGTGIDLSGSIGTEVNGILLYGPNADTLVKASNQGTLASYLRVTQSNFQGKVTASGKCFDLSYIIIADIQTSSFNCYIGIQGLITGAGPPTEVSNTINIGPGNTFQTGNTIHLQNAMWWNVFGNTFEGPTGSSVVYQNTVGGCNTLNMTGNKFDDPVVAGTVVSTNCKQFNSKDNTYSVAGGGTAINYVAASGKLTSIGDWFDTTGVGVALNTGNYATMRGATGPLVSTFMTGIPLTASSIDRVYGPQEVTGPMTMGIISAIAGRIDYNGSTSGTVVTRAQAAAGTPTLLWPTTSGTIAASGTTPISVDATTGAVSLDNAGVTYAKIQNLGALSVMGRSANSTGVGADISTTNGSNAVLRESGGVLGFGPIAGGAIPSGVITYAKIQNLGALSLMGRASNSSGVGADISAVAGSGCIYRESGSTLGCGTITTSHNIAFGSSATIAAGNTAYFSSTGSWSGSEAATSLLYSTASTLRNLRAKVQTAPGAGQSFTVRLRNNTADTSVNCTISDANTSCTDLSNTATIAAGDAVAIRVVASAGAASTNNVSVSLTEQTTTP